MQTRHLSLAWWLQLCAILTLLKLYILVNGGPGTGFKSVSPNGSDAYEMGYSTVAFCGSAANNAHERGRTIQSYCGANPKDLDKNKPLDDAQLAAMVEQHSTQCHPIFLMCWINVRIKLLLLFLTAMSYLVADIIYILETAAAGTSFYYFHYYSYPYYYSFYCYVMLLLLWLNYYFYYF